MINLEDKPTWVNQVLAAGRRGKKFSFRWHNFKVAALLFKYRLRGRVVGEDAHIPPFQGWGRKKTGLLAQRLSSYFNHPYILMEDGLIRSLGLGVNGSASCSVVMDDKGIYYDATCESQLESIIKDLYQQGTVWQNDGYIQRADRLIQRIVDANISKYNAATTDINSVRLNASAITLAELLAKPEKTLLLVDQTAGDQSLMYGGVTEGTFNDIVASALAEHPAANIIIKIHPDVLTGKKKGCFDLSEEGDIQNNSNIYLLSESINPIVLLKNVDHVYVATSQLGFEALMVGKPVTCFGRPFYAGWGLTDDRLAIDRRCNYVELLSLSGHSNIEGHGVSSIRQKILSLVFTAAYIKYTYYQHPDTQEPCQIEAIVSWFEEQYKQFALNQGRIFSFGFTRWKRNYIRCFLQSPDNEIIFVATAQQAIEKGFTSNDHLITWSSKATGDEIGQLSQQFNVPIWRMEDGFLRSTGLGSDFTAPASLVVDRQGIYYDPSSPSDLEYILQNTAIDEALQTRAEALRQKVLQNQLSKYNLGGVVSRESLNIPESKVVVLVPGQVEDDASIKTGCVDVKTNADLIRAARKNAPNAYLIYKPHPDVMSGNRVGQVEKSVTDKYCDCVLEDASITDSLDLTDEVHTMTSLVGFEGLLRDKTVYCYGVPFYSGWGLTQDQVEEHPAYQRRTRSRNLNELVAATYILYPRYVNWDTQAFTSPEFIVDQLKKQIEAQGGKQMNKVSYPLRQVRKLHHIYRGLRG